MIYNSINSSLHFAARRGRTKLVKLLLENNADVNVQDKDGYTPLSTKARWRRNEIEKLLINAGAPS